MEEREKEAVRQATDIVELISGYTPLKKTGTRWKGFCPFHNEKTPSFTVDPERGRWYCFGACATGGDVYKFLEKAESLTFMEAAERLAAKVGITLSRKGVSPAEREEGDRRQSERDRVFAANAIAARYFKEMLARAPFALEYAHEKRKLTHQTLEAFAIGYAPDSWEGLAAYLQKNGVHAADAEKAGLISPRRSDGSFYDKFRARLMFPIVDTQERVAAFGGRILVPQENAPKYLNSPETPVFQKSRTLYALNRARKAIADTNQAVIVEGYMDVVACHQAGFTNVVATLGTSLTDEHVRLLARYTKNVVISFDADDAGVRAALRAAELFATTGQGEFALKVLNLPRGEDPDSLVTSGNVGAFRRAIDEAVSVPEFHLLAIARRHDTANPAGREAFMREALGIIAEVRSGMEQDRLLQKIARFHPSWERGSFHVEESLRGELRRLRFSGGTGEQAATPPAPSGGVNSEPAPRPFVNNGNNRGYRASYGNYRAPAPPTPLSPDQSADVKAEHTVLRALLSDEWSDMVRDRVFPALFSDRRAATLAEAVLAGLEKGAAPSLAIQRIGETDGTLASFADTVLLVDEEPLSLQAVEDCLFFLLEQQVRRQARDLSLRVEETHSAQKEKKESAGEEGESAPSEEELLRQWQNKMQVLKRPSLEERNVPPGDGAQDGT